jgi:hypothetical protein
MSFPDCGHDSRIGAATANIAAHALANFIGGEISRADFAHIGGHVAGVASSGLLQKRDGRANLSRRAVAALETIVLQERTLHGMQLIALRQTLYGCDLLAFMRYGQRETAIDAAAIGQDSARAALSMVATLFRAGELKLFPQKVKQSGTRINGELLLFSIYGELQRDSAILGCGLLDFSHCGSAAVNGKAHDRASREKASRSNKFTPTYGPTRDRVFLLPLLIYSGFTYRLRGFVIHIASSRNDFNQT